MMLIYKKYCKDGEKVCGETTDF